MPRCDCSLVSHARKLVGDLGLTGLWVHGVFNLCGIYRDLADVLADLYNDPDFFAEIMEYSYTRISDFVCQVIDAGADFISMSGNMANGTMVGPKLFEEFVMPYETRLIDLIHARGAKVIYHNCGDARSLLPLYSNRRKVVAQGVGKLIANHKYKELAAEVLRALGFSGWNIVPYYDEYVTVKSRQSLEKYDDTKFFKENGDKLAQAEYIIQMKIDITAKLKRILENDEYKARSQYRRLAKQIDVVLQNAGAYRIRVDYISSAGNNLAAKEIALNRYDIERFRKDPSLLMSKGEYNKLQKEQQKEALSQKQHEYYDRVNSIIDYANENRGSLVIKGSREELDRLIAQLFDRTVSSIKKN